MANSSKRGVSAATISSPAAILYASEGAFGAFWDLPCTAPGRCIFVSFGGNIYGN